MKSNWAKIFFVFIASIELLSQLNISQFTEIHAFTKPMLMPALALFFYFKTKENYHIRKKNWIFLALFFAWFGDIFLMMAGNAPNYFILGLASFLVMQLLYIYIFKVFTFKGLIEKWPFAGAIFFVAFFLLFYLMPHLGSFKIPVIFYFLAILGMVFSALGLWNRQFFGKIVFLGAVLFLISDSLIAINKFHTTIPFSGFWIMATYILAQWFIIKGLTKTDN